MVTWCYVISKFRKMPNEMLSQSRYVTCLTVIAEQEVKALGITIWSMSRSKWTIARLNAGGLSQQEAALRPPLVDQPEDYAIHIDIITVACLTELPNTSHNRQHCSSSDFRT